MFTLLFSGRNWKIEHLPNGLFLLSHLSLQLQTHKRLRDALAEALRLTAIFAAVDGQEMPTVDGLALMGGNVEALAVYGITEYRNASRLIEDVSPLGWTEVAA